MGLVFKNIFLAIPFYFLWNFLAPMYLYSLPDVYKNIPFWHCVGFFLIISILRNVLFSKSNSHAVFKWNNFEFKRPHNGGGQSFQEDSNIKDVTPDRHK
ncbi:MAG: hypothetical protein WA160_03860 [Pseudobdellovibrio sp.]